MNSLFQGPLPPLKMNIDFSKMTPEQEKAHEL